jgi:recombinational DNA repair protein (RecF pathway)
MHNCVDEAFVIFLDNFNNRLKIAKIITKTNGLLKVFIRKENYTKDLQVGSFITYVLERKNKDSATFITYEITKNLINEIFFNKKNLYYFNSMCFILNKFFLYGENLVNIYKSFKNIIFSFKKNDSNLVYDYMVFLLNVVEFFGINSMVYDDKNFYDNHSKVIHIPHNFLLSKMNRNEIRQFIQNVNAVMLDIKTSV